MANNIKKAHIRAIRKLFREIRSNLEDINCKNEDIQEDYSAIKMHMYYLSGKFN